MKWTFFGCFFTLIIILILVTFESWIFMLLWNWLVPLFWVSAPILNIYQSFGILLLINIIGKLLFNSKNN